MKLYELLKVIEPHIHVLAVNQNHAMWPDGEQYRIKGGWYEMEVTTIRAGAFDDLIITVTDPELEV